MITHLESGSSFIRVTWTVPQHTDESSVSRYIVQAIDQNNPNNVLNCSDVTTNHCTIQGLQPNTTYLVRVQATNAAGHGVSTYEKIVTKEKGNSFR